MEYYEYGDSGMIRSMNGTVEEIANFLALEDGMVVTTELFEILHETLVNTRSIMATEEQNTAALAAATAALAELKASEDRQEARLDAILLAKDEHTAAQQAALDAALAEVERLKTANNGIDPALLGPLTEQIIALAARNDAFKATSTPPPPVDPGTGGAPE